MRPFELGLLAAVAVALLALLIGPRVGRVRLRQLALLPIPAALLQLLIEGQRWQLVPLYALAAVLVLGWLFRTVRPRRPPPSGRVGTGILAALGTLALVITAAPPVLVPVFSFPEPTGPYGIGTETYHWTDQGREDIFTDDPNDRRELVAQLWYPEEFGYPASPVPYVDDVTAMRPIAVSQGLPAFAFSHFGLIRSHAVHSSWLATRGTPYPVLIFVHGRGGYRQQSTRQVEQLASQGYAVLSIDLPGLAGGVVLSNGRIATLDPRMTDRPFLERVLPYLAQDVSFALDQLSESPMARFLDLDRVGLFGFSLGGTVIAEACRNDDRFKACLPIDYFMPDPVARDGLRQPTLWLTRDAATMRREGWPESEISATLDSIRATFDRHGPGGYLVRIPGMYHLDFTDAPLISPLTRQLGMSGPIGSARGREIVDAVTSAFFDHHLRGDPEDRTRDLDVRYPELIMERR